MRYSPSVFNDLLAALPVDAKKVPVFLGNPLLAEIHEQGDQDDRDRLAQIYSSLHLRFPDVDLVSRPERTLHRRSATKTA